MIVALNPIVSQVISTFFAIWLQCILTVLTQSYAWNDRVWSLLPPLWAVLYAIHPVISHDNKTGGNFDVRLCVMCALVLIWGLRLTFNGLRRHVFDWGHCDYRIVWILQKKLSNGVVSRFVFFWVFLGFVVGHCTTMLSLACSPFYFAWIRRGDVPAFTILDGVAAFGTAFGILLEAVADEQQWRFHQRKHRLQAEKVAETTKEEAEDSTADAKKDEGTETTTEKPGDSDTSPGIDEFCQTGLFAWCRHPSYFAEMTTWSCFYLFSVSCSGSWLNWCIAGPILYVLLFQGTTPLAEAISLSKYPAYADYQRRVSRLIPLSPSLSPKDTVKQD